MFSCLRPVMPRAVCPDQGTSTSSKIKIKGELFRTVCRSKTFPTCFVFSRYNRVNNIFLADVSARCLTFVSSWCGACGAVKTPAAARCCSRTDRIKRREKDQPKSTRPANQPLLSRLVLTEPKPRLNHSEASERDMLSVRPGVMQVG